MVLIAFIYISLTSAVEQTQCSHVARHYEWVTVSFYSALKKNIHCNFVQTALFACYMASVVQNCCRLGTCSVYTIQPCTSLQSHFIQSHIHKVHVWQNDQDLLCATAVTQGWNRYQNESGQKKVTLEKKICPLLLQAVKPENFTWTLSPLPS